MTNHPAATKTTLRIPAVHCPFEISPLLQHLKLSRLRPITLARPHVAETTPVRRKYGEMPSADRRFAMRYCWGIFAPIVPRMTITCQPIRIPDWFLRWLQSGCNETMLVFYSFTSESELSYLSKPYTSFSAADVTREDSVPSSGNEWLFAFCFCFASFCCRNAIRTG